MAEPENRSYDLQLQPSNSPNRDADDQDNGSQRNDQISSPSPLRSSAHPVSTGHIFNICTTCYRLSDDFQLLSSLQRDEVKTTTNEYADRRDSKIEKASIDGSMETTEKIMEKKANAEIVQVNAEEMRSREKDAEIDTDIENLSENTITTTSSSKVGVSSWNANTHMDQGDREEELEASNTETKKMRLEVPQAAAADDDDEETEKKILMDCEDIAASTDNEKLLDETTSLQDNKHQSTRMMMKVGGENNSLARGGQDDAHQMINPEQQLTIEEELKDRRYRQSGEIFRQHLPCFKLIEVGRSSSLGQISKCRECQARLPQQKTNDIYCRFLDFRCLQYLDDGVLRFNGFPNPYTDYTREDLNIWQPDDETMPTAASMSMEICRYILLHVGDQFCYLWRKESEALWLNQNVENKPIAWKRLVQGIREICDVCDTTLFNYHWTCEVCGFGVCLDCFKDRKLNISIKRNAERKGCDEKFWLLCSNGVSRHQLNKLILTQIIPGDALNVLGRKLHEIRTIWNIPQYCRCLLSTQKLPENLTGIRKCMDDFIRRDQELKKASLNRERHEDFLNRFHRLKIEYAKSEGIHFEAVGSKFRKNPSPSHNDSINKETEEEAEVSCAQIMSMQESMLIAPNVPHEWLCDGKLLRLLDPKNRDNRILFQEVWRRGQPVMISEVSRSLTLSLWHPQTFLQDFGEKPNDLINCLTGNLVPNQPMRHFWEGFLSMNRRLLDANGKPMLLKLKDWPPGDDFAEILPKRYDDLMKGLPMNEYTLRVGQLNLASCLPKMFVPPDLGPKMYNAYGSALYPEKGTTNLHLDISDAVNIMVYVGIPDDTESKQQHAASQIAITMGGCEYLTRARIASNKDITPGALWHIFPARDADKIRDFLNKETLQKGFRLEADHDPIHDQNWYLDEEMRERLFQLYGVQGYPIVQCLGDAVFIPAGAPHQVQNLYNCIKVAEDFVSPENITHCFRLTQEFRRLSHSHTNHEDKLQINNIIYHAVKDCCTIFYRIFTDH